MLVPGKATEEEPALPEGDPAPLLPVAELGDPLPDEPGPPLAKGEFEPRLPEGDVASPVPDGEEAEPPGRSLDPQGDPE